MKKFSNSKKEAFLKTIPTESVDAKSNNLTNRCKFNFSYIDFSQTAGQKFEEWDHLQLIKLLEKLKLYTNESLSYWQNTKIGSNHKRGVLAVYDRFPVNSDFKYPLYIPHEVLWASFRLESSVRLIGFILPKEYKNKVHCSTGNFFDCNTFYVVFLDRDHNFYKTEEK